MPQHHFSEHHEVSVPVAAARAFAAVESADLASSTVVRMLMTARATPAALLAGRLPTARAMTTVRDLEQLGFTNLGRRPGEEIVLGLQGRFWELSGGTACEAAGAFDVPVAPGLARAVWNFRVRDDGGGSIVSTETRILCGDESSRRSFGRYWALIGPFSGMIRTRMLASIREHALDELRDFPPATGKGE